MTLNSSYERYLAAAHAMQTGVKLAHAQGSDDGSPKHLRVGVNTAMCDHTALVKLLISKGVIAEQDYLDAIATEMEAEVERYRSRLHLPENMSLG